MRDKERKGKRISMYGKKRANIPLNEREKKRKDEKRNTKKFESF